jgi:ubiquinone/menaquinone biosynthesis C-methylase UbiE
MSVPESEPEKARRRHQRGLFNTIAGRYQQARPGYPAPLLEFVAATAGLGPGAAVLEVGCGTGQLTERLAGHGYHLTAIDVGPAMIATARARLAAAGVPAAVVTFQAGSFEDLNRPDGSLDLIISSAAFHWIDPEVAFTKPARLLRPGGWLALLGTEERYGEPLDAALEALWSRHGDTGGAWQRRPSDPEAIAATGQFGTPAAWAHQEPAVLTAEEVVALESTRATFLSWPPGRQRRFTGELHRLLGPTPVVPLTRHTSVTVARKGG